MRTKPTTLTRRDMLGALGTAAACAWSPPGEATALDDLKGSGSVVVYDGGGSWGAAQRAAHFDPFEKATGIKVISNPAGPLSELNVSVQAGAPSYDVYGGIDVGQLNEVLRANLVLPIDYRWFDQADLAAFAPMKASEFAVPALYYSVVLAYNTKAFKSSGPKTWVEMWDVGGFPGARTLGSGGNGPNCATYEIALLADGVSPEAIYPLDPCNRSLA
jgi:putative spermidine/putrescine transport system substrate-binding protein